jgi:hypothetical protein
MELESTKSSERRKIEESLVSARRRLQSLDVPGLEENLTRSERDGVRLIANRLRVYFTGGHHALSDIEIEPRIPGCGIISEGTPDLVAWRESNSSRDLVLAEVKSVDRTFRSIDLRQMTAYVALLFSHRHIIPRLLLLVNPLRGTAVELAVEEFFEGAAGSPADTVVQRLLADWSEVGVSG